MIGTIYDRPTWLHWLPAGLKLGLLFGLSLAILPLSNLPGWQGALAMALGLVAVAGLYLSCGGDFVRQALRLLRPILIVALIIGLWHVWWGRPHLAAMIALRLVLLVALAALLTMTTRIEALIAVLETALLRLGLPERPRRILALAVALVMRFLPVLGHKARLLSDSWRARSPRRLSPRIVLPLALLAIDDAEHVAEALRARSGA